MASLYSDECRQKKSFHYVKIMLPLFRAVENISAFSLHQRLLQMQEYFIVDYV